MSVEMGEGVGGRTTSLSLHVEVEFVDALPDLD
jgi:hypothetical protein